MAGLLLSRLAGGAFTSNTRISNTPVIAIICLFSRADEYALDSGSVRGAVCTAAGASSSRAKFCPEQVLRRLETREQRPMWRERQIRALMMREFQRLSYGDADLEIMPRVSDWPPLSGPGGMLV